MTLLGPGRVFRHHLAEELRDFRASFPTFSLGRGRMRLALLEAFPDAEPLEAYERLLLDVMRGDPTLFISTEQVELLWRLFDPLLSDPPTPRRYLRGSWGPSEALRLPGERGWRLPDS